jgi:hypothetical protein
MPGKTLVFPPKTDWPKFTDVDWNSDKRHASSDTGAGPRTGPSNLTISGRLKVKVTLNPAFGRIFEKILCGVRARGHEGPRGIGSGCEIHSARGDDTTQLYCIKQEYRRSARLLPLESLARGCSGSKLFCAPGPAVQGRSSRASSPARPSLDLDHALPSALSPLDQVANIEQP